MMSAIVMPPRPPMAAPAKRRSSVSAVSKNAVLNVFMAFYLCAGSGSARLHFLTTERHLAILRVHVRDDRVAGLDFAFEHLQRERILNEPLDGALHRTRSVGRIVAFAEEQLLGGGGQFDLYLAFGEPLHQALQLQINDALYLRMAERVEDNDGVNPVDESRTEELTQRGHSFFARLPRIIV